MNIAVYRNKETGDVCHVEELKNPISEALQQRVKNYNSNSMHDRKITLLTCEDNGVEAFLLKTKKGNIKDFREDLENLACAVERLPAELTYIDNLVRNWNNEEDWD